MKVIKTVLVVLGLLVLVAGGVLLGQSTTGINELHAAASANRTQAFENPLSLVLIMAGAIFAGALLLGIGLTIPRRRLVNRPGDDRLPAVKPHGVS